MFVVICCHSCNTFGSINITQMNFNHHEIEIIIYTGALLLTDLQNNLALRSIYITEFNAELTYGSNAINVITIFSFDAIRNVVMDM